MEVLFEVTGYGTEITLEQLWEGIEAVISRRELRDAVEVVTAAASLAEARAPNPVPVICETRPGP